MRKLVQYAEAMRNAMIAEGIPFVQALDAANNSATPLAMFRELDVHDVISTRLKLQRRFGLDADDETIDRAARAAATVERFFEDE